MEVKNPEALELICKSQKSIHNIKDTISQKKEIKELADNIKKIIDTMDKSIKDEASNLKEYEERLKELKSEELSEHIDMIKMVIESNLPKNVKCDSIDNKMYLYINELKERCINPSRIDVAEIEIISDISDKDIIKVMIKDSERTKYNINEFDINENVLRVYKVISYIHDNLSYDE